MGFLIWLEESFLSTWIRESPSLWAFPFILFLHTLGLALLVGINLVINLWVLGFTPRSGIEPMERFYLFAWIGFWINAVSGILLLIAYPTKALTNPVFYLKLGLITWAVANLQWMRKAIFSNLNVENPSDGDRRIPRVAWLTLVLWVGAIWAGRFLAYTYNFLTASELMF